MSTSTEKTKHNPHLGNLALVTFRILFVVLLITAGSFLAQAQDPAPAASPTPSAREQRLIEENRILEQEEARAKHIKAIRDAQPQPSSTPLAGDTTADDKVIIETQMVTYKAMSDVAERIGTQIHEKVGGAKAIAIYDADELQNLKHYRAAAPVINGRIKSLADRYQRVFKEIEENTQATKLTGLDDVQTEAVSDSNAKKFSLKAEEAGSPLPLVSGFAGAAGEFGTGLKALADLLALMRTDTVIKGREVTVEERAMVAETFRALRNKFGKNVSLYYPSLVPPQANFECARGADKEFCSPFLSTLANLYENKEVADTKLFERQFALTAEFDSLTKRKTAAAEEIGTLAKKIDDLKLERLNSELKKPWTRFQIARFEKFVRELESRKIDAAREKESAEARLRLVAQQKALMESLQSLNQQFDEMVANLSKPDDKTGRSELANVLRAENIDEIMSNEGYWLEFKAVNAGGNNRTRKNLFRYFSGAKIDHSGGVIIEWALYDRNGATVESNTDRSYPGYFAPKEIQKGKLQDAVADQRPPQTPGVAKSGNQ
jgi:hypothetical protein